jgi:hypothetical protein
MDNDSPVLGQNFDYYGNPIENDHIDDDYPYSIPSRTPPSLTLDDLATNFNQDPEVQGEGIAYQIHNVFANIRENMDEIFKTMGGKLTVFPLDLSKNDFFYCMKWSFRYCIVNGPEGIVYEKKVNQILNKLHLSSLIQPPKVPYDGLCDDIFTWQQFVMRQPQEFRTHYVRCFVEDTYYAYDGEDGEDGGGISCVEGIYERILTSIGDACILYCTEFKKKNKKKRKTKKKTNGKSKSSTRSTSQAGGNYKSKFHTCDNPVYRKLIKLFKKEIPDINELTKEWSKILEHEISASLTETQLKTNFIQFVNKKYTLYGLDKKDIVEKRANELEEAGIFANREFGS